MTKHWLLLLGLCCVASVAHAKYTSAVQGTTWTLTGDGRGDTLAIRLNASDSTMLEAVVGKDPNTPPQFTMARAAIESISVDAGGGNDTVVVGPGFGEIGALIDGGKGNDTLSGGSGNDFLIGGDGNDTFDPGPGNDTVLAGKGNDVVIWNPGDGSDIIEGQDGDDRLEFNGANLSEQFDLSANGGRVRFLRDVASITLDLNDVEELDLSALGGIDRLTVHDLSGTDLVRLAVELAASGGGGDAATDTIRLEGTDGGVPDVVTMGATKGVTEVVGLPVDVRVFNGEAADAVVFMGAANDELHVLGTKADDVMTLTPSVSDLLVSADSLPMQLGLSGTGTFMSVFGLSGDDLINASSGSVSGLGITLSLDGGSGNDLIIGSNGNDFINAGSGNDIVSGKQGDDVVLAGSGNDVLNWSPGDGNDTLEGEGGTDTLEVSGNAVAESYEIFANGKRARLTRNVANILMDLNQIERVDISTSGGADSVIVDDLIGTGVKLVKIDLGSDASIDSIVQNETAKADSVSLKLDDGGVSIRQKGASTLVLDQEPTDTLTVNGLGGTDKIKVGDGVEAAIALTVNQD